MADETPEELEERQQVPRSAAHTEAMAMYRGCAHGVLSTLSARFDGWPFASVVPYAPDREGRPLIYVASIAQHTKNLKADPRCSLFMHPEVPAGQDAQTFGRLTWMGRAEPVPEADREDGFARYLARLPVANKYEMTHDFSLWRIQPVQGRWIGGFGKIFWMEPEALLEPSAQDGLREAAAGIIQHMNEDHVDALATYCEAFYGVVPKGAQMVGIDRFGFDVLAETPKRRFRFDFPEPITPAGARGAIVAMLGRARAKLSA